MTGFILAAFAAVNFVECPKCDKRVRISEDGKEAFVNLCRIDATRKDEMKARAERLLERAKPVAPANPLTPLMGWSSWNTFALDISEEIIVGVARTMATNGLKAAGYVYVNIDDGFFDGHGADGRLRMHPVRFPNGMKGTVDGIHALGMKAGTYSDAGANTCGRIAGCTSASLASTSSRSTTAAEGSSSLTSGRAIPRSRMPSRRRGGRTCASTYAAGRSRELGRRTSRGRGARRATSGPAGSLCATSSPKTST